MPMPMDDWKTRKLQLKPGETKAAGPASVLLLVYAGAIDSPEVGRTFPLHGEEMIIGRSSDADIQVDRDSVSRRHARLQRQSDGWVVSDLQSTNGSYINDMPVREQRLLSVVMLAGADDPGRRLSAVDLFFGADPSAATAPTMTSAEASSALEPCRAVVAARGGRAEALPGGDSVGLYGGYLEKRVLQGLERP